MVRSRTTGTEKEVFVSAECFYRRNASAGCTVGISSLKGEKK